jgi:hypothetical protein
MANEGDIEFRKFCTEQVKRLGAFEKFQYLTPEGLKEYRKFFESKTRDRVKVSAVIDAAVELESLPTINALAQIWMRLFPVVSGWRPDTPEEIEASRNHMREWREQEAREAAVRRAQWLARREETATPVTDAEIARIASGQKAAQELLRKLQETPAEPAGDPA